VDTNVMHTAGETPVTGRRRKRSTIMWLAFLVIGLAMGSVWATGFSVSGSANGADNAAVDVPGTDNVADASTSPYAGLITNPEDLTVDWNGLWGVVGGDVAMYEVDLSGEAALDNFYVEIYVDSTATDWSVQQYQFHRFDDPATCGAATDLTALAPDESQTMAVTDEDAFVSFDALPGGAVYCFGIEAIAQADNETGTFLRRPDETTFPTPTQFTGIVNEQV
jgi:hypothetical protein